MPNDISTAPSNLITDLNDEPRALTGYVVSPADLTNMLSGRPAVIRPASFNPRDDDMKIYVLLAAQTELLEVGASDG